ncbi:S1 family peptidase [Catenovulum sediminis]|uniref:Serine protease n=1 Tax=Catenovulum sediminis TaxID=1740262 RepID=A0ABV1RG16_9ALTE
MWLKKIKPAWLIPTTILFSATLHAHSSDLPKKVSAVKKSVVGIGIYNPTGSPRARLIGTGFAVKKDLIATNYHVISTLLEDNQKEKYVVFVGTGRSPKIMDALIITQDKEHDLALLKVPHANLQPLQLQKKPQSYIQDATEIAFTGYPIGAVLGLYPVTHRGIISALTPVAIPVDTSAQLNLANLKRLRDPFFTYQLDATAYPGNSGSPVYLQHDGTVIAIINKVFVKESKESVLSKPSGITYAIPVKHLVELLEKTKE